MRIITLYKTLLPIMLLFGFNLIGMDYEEQTSRFQEMNESATEIQSQNIYDVKHHKQTVCIHCHRSFEIGQAVAILKCKHILHERCAHQIIGEDITAKCLYGCKSTVCDSSTLREMGFEESEEKVTESSPIANQIKVTNDFTQVKASQDCEECSICTCEFEEDDNNPTIMLGCGHKFHSSCIGGWIEQKQTLTTCPNCRAAITIPTEVTYEKSKKFSNQIDKPNIIKMYKDLGQEPPKVIDKSFKADAQFILSETTVALVLGLATRGLWASKMLTSKKENIRNVGFATLGGGFFCGQLFLKEINPHRADHLVQLGLSWLVGFSTGAWLLPKLLAKKEKLQLKAS